MRRPGWVLLLISVFVAACGPSKGAPHDQPAMRTSAGSLASDSALVVDLERAARALSVSGPCTNAAQCATAPVGARACGGPREYLAYCRSATDSSALFTKLGELERAEQALNTKRGAMSTCEMRLPPATELAGQVCREAQR